MTISQHAASSRESARRSSGRFGHQQHGESSVSLDAEGESDAADELQDQSAERPEGAKRTSGDQDYATKDIWEACGKCGGAGSVSWGMPVSGAVRHQDGSVEEVGKVCFTCGGTRGKFVSQQQLDRREKDRARRLRQIEAEAAERVATHQAREAAAAAERDAKHEQYLKDNPGVDEALDALQGRFADDMRDNLGTYGSLTERQTEAVLRMAAEQANAPEPTPVVPGRGPLTGTVMSIKPHVDYYNGNTRHSHKITLLDDRGFRVHGTVPASIQDRVERGTRLSLTATTSASDDDETFGFFKRPTSAQILEEDTQGVVEQD